MARIQKRQTRSGTPTYVVKWRTPDGHDRTKGGFPTRKAANAYATKVEAGKLRGVEFDPKAGGLTFRIAAQAWLNSRHDLKPTTLAGYRRALAPAQRLYGPSRQDLSIDATFGGYPLNAITREQITQWVAELSAAGKHPVTVRHAVLLVKQVLAQAVADKRLPDNPAEHVKLPGERGTRAVVDDPAQFLTAAQVTALVAATPWPYNVLVHVAAWAGLRAAELAGLQVGDVELPTAVQPALTPTAPTRPGGYLHVARTIQPLNGALTYLPPKTRGSRRRVPLTAETTGLLRDYLAEHPYGPTAAACKPTAPLFPDLRLTPPQTADLAALATQEAEARLVLDWAEPLRHLTFYRTVFRPAVARARRQPARRPASRDGVPLAAAYVRKPVRRGGHTAA